MLVSVGRPCLKVSSRCSSLRTHVLDLEHRLSVLLHEVHLVSVGSIDVLHLIADIVFARIEVLGVRIRRDVGRWIAVRVGRENLCERVPHL